MTVEQAVQQAIMQTVQTMADRVRIVGVGPPLDDPHITHRSVTAESFADLLGDYTIVRRWPVYEVNVWDCDAARGASTALQIDQQLPYHMPAGWIAFPRGYHHAAYDDGWHRWIVEFEVIGGE